MTTIVEPETAVAPAPAPARTAPPTAPDRDRVWFLGVPFAIATVLAFAHTTDDALITLRYAWHLVHGDGPVFNVGEHVAGYSSPLHLVVSTGIVAAPHAWALVVAKLVSLGFGVLTLWQGARLADIVLRAPWARRTAYLLLACSCPLALSAANGLETTMYAFLVTLLLVRLVGSDEAGSSVATAVVAGLVVATRPEGALVVAMLAGASLVVERGRPRIARARWALGGVVGLAITLGATGLLTGGMLPNTFYAKHIPLTRALPDGIRYLRDTFALAGARGGREVVAMLLLWAVTVCVVCGASRAVRLQSRARYALAVVAAQLGFAVATGGDWMHGGRFVVAAVPALVVLAVSGLVTLVEAGAARRPDLRRVATLGGAVVLLAATAMPWATQAVPVWRLRGVDDDAFVAAGGYAEYTAAWSALPTVLACLPGARSIATTEAGNAGWWDPRLRVLDLRGLTDDTIARKAPESEHGQVGVDAKDWWRPQSVVGRRLLAWRPDAVVLLDSEGPMPARALEGAYLRRGTVPLGAGSALVVYTRPALPPACLPATAAGAA